LSDLIILVLKVDARAIDVLGFTTPAGNFEFEIFQSPRLATTSTHGTGCAFSAAIAANLALGKNLEEAVRSAKRYVTKALKQRFKLGRGRAVLDHFA